MITFFFYRLPALLWAGLIMLLLSLPSSQIPTVQIPHLDKAFHALIFGIQAALLYRAFRHPVPLRFAGLSPELLASIVTILYATVSEAYQIFLPDRTAEVLDALANSVGVGAFLLLLWWRKRGKR